MWIFPNIFSGSYFISRFSYAALLASVTAINKTFIRSLPSNKQLDWEAIFATDVRTFVDHVISWFELKDADSILDDVSVALKQLTIREMVEVLNFES